MLRDQVVIMPPARWLRRAKRALKHGHAVEMALLLSPQATSFAAVAGLDKVLAWSQEFRRDLTLVGGSPALRAEAVAYGLRVATDIASWESWLIDSLNRVALPASSTEARQAWRVIRPAVAVESDTLPDFVAVLGMTAGLTVIDPLARPPDECYEDAVIATLWDTSDFTGPLPHISNG